MQAFWEITRKDLWLLLRDRRALAVMVLFPIIFIMIIGFSTGQLLGWRSNNMVLRVIVVNHDGSPMSQQVIDAFKNREGMEVETIGDEEQARSRIADGKVTALVVIGSEFMPKVDELFIGEILDTTSGPLSQGLSAFDIRVEGRSTLAAPQSLVRQLVFADALRTIAPYVANKNNMARTWIQNAREAEEGRPAEPAADEQTIEAAAVKENVVYQEIVPGYTVMFVFFLVNVMSYSFLQERQQGTLKRLRAAPISPAAVMLGKTFPYLILSLIQTGLLFLFGKLTFDMSWGKYPLMLLPVIFASSLAATGLGLLVSAVVKTESQVVAYANLIVITMAGIAGCFIPRSWLPELMQQISLATPHAWALQAYHELLTNESPRLAPVWEYSGILVGFFAVYFTLGWWRFRQVE